MSSPQKTTIYYGWAIVAVCAVLLMVVFGIRLSFSVFFVALIDEFGWSRADTSLIFSTTMVVFAASSTLSGIVLDRLGPRVTFSGGLLILAAGLALSTQITTLSGLVLTYGVVAGLGIAVLGLSMQASVIARWFVRQRGTAIGLAFAGTGIGSLLVTPLMETVIARYDWRIAYWVLVGLALALLPLVMIFLRRDPARMGLVLEGEPASERTQLKPDSAAPVRWTLARTLRAPAFWLVVLAGVGTMGPIRMLTVHQLAMMDDIGIATAVGARVVGLVGAVTALTFVGSGMLSDKIGRIPTYALGSLSTICATLLIATLTLSQTSLIWVYAILLGLGEGSRSSLVSAVSSDLFAGPTMGAINGTIGGSFGLGAAALPWLAGAIFDTTGSYRSAFVISIVTTIVSACALWLAKRLGGENGKW